MGGARLKIERERELCWWGAMLPYLKKPVPLEEFTGHRPDEAERIRRFHAAWDTVDRALARG